MARTILQIAQSAAPRMGIPVPEAVMAGTDREVVEMASVINEAAEGIARAHDWAVLKTTETCVGDGTTTDFALPADYLRMPKDAQMWSTRWQRPLTAVSPETQLQLDIRNFDMVTGTWTIQGGSVVFAPALASGESAKYLYITNTVFAPQSGSNKARATADTDTFRLGDRLLELHLIWQWRQMKGFPYAEDMATAEMALAQAISEDKGARIVTQSSRRNTRANVAYPWEITP